MENYYEVLGITKDATENEVKAAYRKKAALHHPDRGGDEKIFKLVSEAYKVLKDASTRKAYDEGNYKPKVDIQQEVYSILAEMYMRVVEMDVDSNTLRAMRHLAVKSLQDVGNNLKQLRFKSKKYRNSGKKLKDATGKNENFFSSIAYNRRLTLVKTCLELRRGRMILKRVLKFLDSWEFETGSDNPLPVNHVRTFISTYTQT